MIGISLWQNIDWKGYIQVDIGFNRPANDELATHLEGPNACDDPEETKY